MAWGHPNFKAGKKTFAVLENYKKELSIAVKVTPLIKKDLLKDHRFYDTPYIGSKGWVSMRVHLKPIDWKLVQNLVDTSYRLVASKRMLIQLDA
ncbi:MAG: MmcQ/YjbR family DNA-binding protein [Bdellovibrionales bacterium]|nr:MmcQ/YjbR family DNA-binding protein [Bdellovibrionales bacterium]